MIRRCLFLTVLAIFMLAQFIYASGDDREGGISGTGISGVITDLGSIHVNGIKIEVGDAQVVSSVFGQRIAGSLEAGESVAIDVVRQGDAWHATHLKHYVPLLGPLARSAGNSFSVLGSNLIITSDTQFRGFSDKDDLVDGEWVLVDGLWRGSSVVASRMTKIPARQIASVTGSYSPPQNSDDSFLIGNTRIEGIQPQHLSRGDVITVEGLVTENGLSAQSINKGLFTGNPGIALVEGYLTKPDAVGYYTLQGTGLVAYVDGTPTAMSSERGLYCAKVESKLKIKKVADLPETTLLRHDVMNRITKGWTQLCQN